ncbi:hypothetical protein V6N13_035677 [Hibiscus sabdariffa]
MGDERSRQERKSPWGGDFKRRGKHLGEGIRWRKGVSVFVDRVSKRIHRLTLKEAFSVYGNVIDVYIAYNNSRRINKAYTFAFIRFLTLDEARRAVDRAHNRRMDGFFIRVFMGKEQQSNVSAKNINECRRGPKSISEDNLVAKVISNKSVDKSRVFMYTNGRSYKEVLMSKPMSNPGDDVDRQALTNRWGSFISVEDDTSKRVRLDKARILVGVSQVSDIPQSTNIFINGEKFCIRVSVAAFEDHRCSIDALGTQANVDVMVENQGDGDESGKFEANNLVENNLEVGLAQSGQSQVQIGDSEGLVDIPIAQQSGSSKFSDESSEAHLPLLDKESGLFKVRPKYLRSARNSSKLSFRSKVDKALWWASPNFTPVPSKQKRDKGKSSSSMSVSVALDRPSSRSNQEDYNEEIQAILETCKALEIRFKGGDEAVSKRILLSWNVRGFKRKEKIKAARDLLARVKPSVGFFQETKLDQVNGNFGRKLWGNLHRCVVSSPAIGSVGGLISTWDPEFFSVSDRIINQRFIVLVETLTNGNHSFGFVNVYGPSIDSAKTEFFEELYKVIAKFNVAWVVGGDFNAFLNPEEKLGLSLNSFSMNVFKEFVGNMQGIDLPLCGGAFTWCNNRDPPTFVKLDRFIVTADVLLKFPNICQVLLPRAISDHNAILLHYTPVNWGPKPFKIFNYWVHKAGFDDLMASVFSNHNSNGSHKGIGALLRDSKKAIKAWRESQCQDRNVSIDKLVASINEMEGKIQSGVLPSSAMIEVASHVSRAFWCWSPPPLGFLKYNIDGACSLEGRCGVGGVLRDENGSTLMEFSLSIGYGSALLAEILAIKFAVERFMSSLWIDRSRLVIESDSSTAVAWVLNPSLASLPFSELVHGIHPFFSDGRWVIRHIRRIQNVHADFLAKAGIG